MLLLASACSRSGCSGGPTSGESDSGSHDATLDGLLTKDGSPADAPSDASAKDSGTGPLTDAQIDVDAPGYQWLFDNAWKAVLTQPSCDVRVGEVTKLKWPGFSWTSCGTGCRRAAAVNGPDAPWKGANRIGSGSRTTKGALTIYLAAGVRLPPGAGWVAALEVPSWKPVSIVRNYGDDCTMSFSRNHTSVFQLLQNDGQATLGQTLSSSVVFASPTHKLGSRYFDLVGGWGHIAASSVIGVSIDTTSTAFSTVYSSPGPLEHPRGVGQAVLWRDWSGPTASTAVWTKQGGARTLLQASYHVVQHAATDDRVVWVGATGSALPGSDYSTAQLYWSDLKLDPDQIVPKAGPKLPLKYTPHPLFAAGKWVTMYGNGVSSVLVANLDTNALWTIPTPPGHFRTPLGISSSTLVVADATPGFGQPSQLFDQIVEYDLNQISSFAQTVP